MRLQKRPLRKVFSKKYLVNTLNKKARFLNKESGFFIDILILISKNIKLNSFIFHKNSFAITQKFDIHFIKILLAKN